MPAVSDTFWRVAFFRSQNSWGPAPGPRPRPPGAPQLKRLDPLYAPLPVPRPRTPRRAPRNPPKRPGLVSRIWQGLWKRRQSKKWEPSAGHAKGAMKGRKRGQRKVLAFLMGRPRRHCTKSNASGTNSALKIDNLRPRQVLKLRDTIKVINNLRNSCYA